MRFVAERILPAYLDALETALADAVRRLPPGALRRTLQRLRRRLDRADPRPRLADLHRLAILGEAQGWLDPEEAIVLRRLAYRVTVLQERVQLQGVSQRTWLARWQAGAVGRSAPSDPRSYRYPLAWRAKSSA